MTSRQGIIERINHLNEDTARWTGVFRKRHATELAEFKETMRNLSVISGALAAGSLVLLGSTVKQVQILTILGITSLFAATIVGVWLLYVKHHKVFKGIQQDRKRYLHPTIDVLRQLTEAHTHEELVAAVEAHERWKIERKALTIVSTADYGDAEFESPKGFWWTILLSMLGVVFIVVALLLPYFHLAIILNDIHSLVALFKPS